MWRRSFFAFLGEDEMIGGVGAARRGPFAARLKALERKLSNGGKHQEARFSLRLLDLLDQALVDHGSHTVEHVESEVSPGVADGLNTLQRAAAGKHRKP